MKSKKKTRVRLTNDEKAAGMTVEQKRNGLTLNKMKKQTVKVEISSGEVEVEHIKTQKELEEQHEKANSSGLGDAIEAITEATGIKKLVKFIAGDDCGCEERKKKMNKLNLRGKRPLCLVEKEYDFLHDFFTVRNSDYVNASENEKFRAIYSRIMAVHLSAMGSCDGCMRDIIKQLRKIYSTYE